MRVSRICYLPTRFSGKGYRSWSARSSGITSPCLPSNINKHWPNSRRADELSMRQAFIQTLHELAASDPRVVLLTADLGFTVLEPFAKSYPDRFFNVGVAEANMVGMATGLAEAGYIPFLYSIATF